MINLPENNEYERQYISSYCIEISKNPSFWKLRGNSTHPIFYIASGYDEA